MYKSIFEKVCEGSEVSFTITVPSDMDPDALMTELNGDYAEGNNLFDHIDDYKARGKRIVTVVYNPKGNASAWAKKVAKSLEQDSGYDVNYVIN